MQRFVKCLCLVAGLLLASGGAFAAEPASRPARPAAPGVAHKRTSAIVTVSLGGVVTDGSGAGWPLYARVVATSDSTDPIVAFTDPTTGAYSMDLFDGIDYAVAVTSLVPGYLPTGGPVTAAGSAITRDWQVAVNAAACVAPGYQPAGFDAVLSEGFDAGVLPQGWTVDTLTGASWDILDGADPCGAFPGNQTGGTGAFAVINSNCYSNGLDNENSSLVTPPIDLSALPSAAIRWNNDYKELNGEADVDVTTDGGTTWTNVWQRTNKSELGPQVQTVDVSFAAGHAGVQARFHYNAFWAWWWQVDDILVGQALCDPQAGGLVAGHVYDANTGLGLNGATVTNLTTPGSVTTVETGDPLQGEGFYAFFVAVGSPQFEAALVPYTPQTKGTTVADKSVVRLDFSLEAARFDPAPRPVSISVARGGSADQDLSLGNLGAAAGTFRLLELDAPSTAAPEAAVPGRFASPSEIRTAMRRVPPGRWNAADTRGLAPAEPTPGLVPQLPGAGNVISSFSSNLNAGWGLAYDTDAGTLWVSSPYDELNFPDGDGFEHDYLPDGTATADVIDIHATGGYWQADGTYNQRTGMIWQLNVGGDDCLFEMDPATKLVTGQKICGPWPVSQRGVAYDYVTDTYYAGGWNESTIYHIDRNGALLDSKMVSIPISGLAYNPSTGHLFVAGQTLPFDVHILDTRNDYAPIGGVAVTANGVPVLGGNGVSLEADCNNHLWIYHPFDQIVYEFESGETGWCANNIPWLTETPDAGTVQGGETLPIHLHFDAAGLPPGLHLGQLLLRQDSPYEVDPVAVEFTVLFDDVPTDAFAANFIYAAAGAGVMPGGFPVCAAGSFCANGIVTRAAMAGYIYRAALGASAAPPVYAYTFGDVAFADFNSFYIQGISDLAITAGCGGGNYCPSGPNTRAQMAVFVWKAEHGATPPPACAGVFNDVPCPGGFAADYIEGIASEGVTAGCGNGNFCPDANITNAQMAVFLVKAFHLPYLP
jgi:hypothetical protein